MTSRASLRPQRPVENAVAANDTRLVIYIAPLLEHDVDLFKVGHTTFVDRDYPADVAVYGADYFEIPVLMSGTTLKPKVQYIGPNKYEPAK